MRTKRHMRPAIRLCTALLVIMAVACFPGAVRVSHAAAGTLAQEVPPPRVDSPSCVVMDALSGQVLFEKDAHTKRSPASVTKIMTLVLAFEDIASGAVSFADQVTASENAADMGGTEVWAEPGESMPLEEWLKAVAVASANDGAVILAEYLSGTEEAFAHRMNARARELGMSDTNFVNSHGLDAEGHLTTAMDVAILSRHAVTVPHLLDYTKIYQQEFRGGKNELTNFNKLVYLYPGCDGLKTGHTSKSGYCISATGTRDSSRFVVVLMGAQTPDQRMNDAWKLLDWAFANFRSLEILREGEYIGQTPVLKGKSDAVEIRPGQPFAVTLTRGEKGEVKKTINLTRLEAPIAKGDQVGSIEVEVDGRKVSEIPLVAARDVARAGFLDYALRYLRAFTVGR